MGETQSLYVVRPMSAGDRAQWEELFLAYGVFYETSFGPEVLEGVWGWLMDPAHPVSGFVASHEDTLLGFAHLREHPDTFEAGPSWFLDDLFTRPEARGKGVARSLINALSDHVASHGGGTIRWITASDNTTAQGLYDQIATRTSWVMYEKEAKG
jgi:ribosomal protein S18 acetylase RimI-like enzyme